MNTQKRFDVALVFASGLLLLFILANPGTAIHVAVWAEWFLPFVIGLALGLGATLQRFRSSDHNRGLAIASCMFVALLVTLAMREVSHTIGLAIGGSERIVRVEIVNSSEASRLVNRCRRTVLLRLTTSDQIEICAKSHLRSSIATGVLTPGTSATLHITQNFIGTWVTSIEVP